MLASGQLNLLGHRSWTRSRRRPAPNRRCKYKSFGPHQALGGVNSVCLHLLIWCILVNQVLSSSSSFPFLLPPHHQQQRQLSLHTQRYLFYHLNIADDDHRVAPLSVLSDSQALRQQQAPNCPGPCSCMWKNGKETATCDRRQLNSVPVGLATTTQVIDLSGNALNHLPANVFLDRGLVNLQRIFLVDCHLCKLSVKVLFFVFACLISCNINILIPEWMWLVEKDREQSIEAIEQAETVSATL